MQYNKNSGLFKFHLPLDENDPTIKRILAAAVEQFSLVGIRKSSIPDIASRAEVSKMTIYRRIGNQQKLIQAALLSELSQILLKINENLNKKESVTERVVEGLTIAYVEIMKHPLWRQLMRTEPGEVLQHLTLEAGTYIIFGSKYIQKIIDESPESVTIESELLAQYTLRLFHSMALSPDPILEDKDEFFIREYFTDYLTPFLEAFIE